jgi:hypothetical protein
MNLEERTKQYWKLSALFYAGVGKTMSMHDAIQAVGEGIDNLGPNRRLRNDFIKLNDRLIQGRGKRRKTSKVPNNIVQLKKTAI